MTLDHFFTVLKVIITHRDPNFVLTGPFHLIGDLGYIAELTHRDHPDLHAPIVWSPQDLVHFTPEVISVMADNAIASFKLALEPEHPLATEAAFGDLRINEREDD